ncbi:putative membrane protein [Clostridioides difficile CD160]|nr:putative membrane protein [Clostridioides difficile CD160]
MLLNNKGSILIMTLIIFSIISTVCIMTIGLIYTHNNIFELEYKDIQLKETSLSGIEISISNVFSCVGEAINISNSEDEFRTYFLGNNMINCIKKIKDTSHSNLEDVSLKVENNTIYDKGDFFELDITSSVREKDFLKVIKVRVKIKNPWVGIDIEDYMDESNIEVFNEYESFEENEILNEFEAESESTSNQELDESIEEEIKQNIIENIKKSFDEKNLVYVYKYRGV